MLFPTYKALQTALQDEGRMQQYRRKLAAQLGPQHFNACIDHTALKEKASIAKVVNEAMALGMQICTDELRFIEAYDRVARHRNVQPDKPVVSIVCDFPDGKGSIAQRVQEARHILKHGAHEIDMVADADLYLAHAGPQYIEHIQCVADLVAEHWRKSYQPVLKVIINSWKLKDDKVIEAVSTAIAEMGRGYRIKVNGEEQAMAIGVKNSTGFAPDKSTDVSATPEHIWLMRKGAGAYNAKKNPIMVKAAAGIGDEDTALNMMLAGGLLTAEEKLVVPAEDAYKVVRIGTSNGPKIAHGFVENYAA